MRTATPTYAECFQAGADARAGGKPKSANPYPPLCGHHDEWLEGWKATLDLDEEDDPGSNRMKVQDECVGLAAVSPIFSRFLPRWLGG